VDVQSVKPENPNLLSHHKFFAPSTPLVDGVSLIVMGYGETRRTLPIGVCPDPGPAESSRSNRLYRLLRRGSRDSCDHFPIESAVLGAAGVEDGGRNHGPETFRLGKIREFRWGTG